MMREVWVVTGEYCLGSEDGETFWVEGVYNSRAKAERAQALAEVNYHEEHPSAVIFEREDLGFSKESVEWDVAFSISRHPVQ